MIHHVTTEIAVIGAGVVGLAVAEALVAQGHEVVLIDPEPPGSGASYGNAGTIADYAVLPVGTPDVLKNLPSLLFDRNSPLAIRPGAMLSLAPWLSRFMLQSRRKTAERNARAIAELLSGARALWQDLALRSGGADLLQHNGCLYLYETEKAFRAAQADMAYRRGLGVAVDLIGPQDLAQLEPNLPDMAGAAYFSGAAFLSDPGAMMQCLAEAALNYAGFLNGRIDRLTRDFDGIWLEGPKCRVRAKKAILCAGAHSQPLAAMAGDKVPLETERGYHLEWQMPAPILNRPACPSARGFYLCPMTGRLRVAGTVELGGLTAPPSRHRLDRLLQGARKIFPDLPKPSARWMGFRPSLPDSLPVIGPSSGGADVIHAFGHGHIGVTLAPITGRIVADLVRGKQPEVDITPYLPTRF